MTIFNVLPKVDYCCFCISLKWGSVLIAIYTMLSFGVSFASSYYIKCEDGGAYQDIMDIATYVLLAVNALAFIASIVFLFGIIKHIPETAIFFMYIILIAIVINLVFIVLSIVYSVMDPECSRYGNIIVPAISLIMWIYFLSVVSSYEEKMLD